MTLVLSLPGAHGWIDGCRHMPSPNCDERPTAMPIDLLVIHAISLPPGRFGGDDIEALFTNCLDPAADPFYPSICDLKVSAHFLIRRDGELIQFVPATLRAWHAGESSWRGRSWRRLTGARRRATRSVEVRGNLPGAQAGADADRRRSAAARF